MTYLLSRSEAIVRLLSQALILVVGLCALAMMVNVVADVSAKYLFNRPIYGTSELVGNYYMIAIVFLSIPLVELNNRQIYVDLLFNMFGRRLQRATLVLVFALQASFHALIGLESFHAAVEAMNKREIVEGYFAMIIWPARYFLVIGFAIGFAIAILRLVQTLAAHPAIDGYLTHKTRIEDA